MWGRDVDNVDISLDLPTSAFTFPRGGEVRKNENIRTYSGRQIH